MAVRSRPVFSVTLVLALLVPGLAVQVPVGAEDRASPPVQSFALFTAPGEQQYIRLDPATLGEMDDREMLEFETAFPIWLVSEDGSTMVLAEDLEHGSIGVFDGLNGPERLRIDGSGTWGPRALSADGSRLVSFGSTSCVAPTCVTPAWTVFNTHTGNVISRITGEVGGWGEILVDRTAEHLYQLTYDDGDDLIGPWPLQIIAYDLTTGDEIGRLKLPTVLGGMWGADWVEEIPVFNQDSPAVALSPDGDSLAVVNPTTEQLTLVETETLRVASTRGLSSAEGIGQRFWQWLGIAPRSVEAKFMIGRQLEAVFAPDSQHLYLWGTEASISDTADEAERLGLGVRLIDIDSGLIVAGALEGMALDSVLPTPDGDTIYTSGYTDPSFAAPAATPFELRRLDSQTLETQAERELIQFSRLVIVPTGRAA